MRVEIDRDYIVDVDDYNHTLKRRIFDEEGNIRKNKRGEDSEAIIGYFPNMELAVNRIMREKEARSEDCTLDEYIEKLKELRMERDGIVTDLRKKFK